MRTPSVVLCATLLTAGAASAEPVLDDGTRVGAPLSHKNLTLLPLVGPAAGGDDDYLVLDEGMDKGLVKVHEREGGGSVNQLVVENKGKKPLFLMSGEVILGGQQDRIIGKDVIIPPSQRKEVAVFCVEHGRWQGGAAFASGKAMAHAKLRSTANYDDNQGAVWAEVAEKNKVRGTENETGTYRRVATDDKTVKPYADALGVALAAAPDHDRIVGVAVALNGKVVAIEQFATPRLFGKVRDKLLRSYYVEALDAPTDAAAKPPVAADVVAFARKEKETTEETVVDEGAVKTQRMSGKDGVKGTKVIDAHPDKPVYKSLHQD
jgi:ARG/rhodanese/phosphatase superfamily protein